MTDGRTERGRRIIVGAAIIGAAGALSSIGGAFFFPRAAAFSYLTAWITVLTIALGALSMLMIAHLTGAHWFEPLVPLTRATAGTLPLLGVLFVPIYFALHTLYPWVPPMPHMDPTVHDHIMRKTAYLNVPFFLARTGAYFAIWIALAEILLRGSPDTRRRWSAIGLPFYGFATYFASVDWLMSLLPAWWSSVYGVYFWAGSILGALAWIAVAGYFAAMPGVPREDVATRANTLGKLILAFLLFWIYIGGFSQFIVIWIGNIPLEVSWLSTRLNSGWGAFSGFLLLGQFGLPFLLLLRHTHRERPGALGLIAGWVLIMHYIDIYWLVMPEFAPHGWTPNWLNLTTIAGVAGLSVAFGGWRLSKMLPVPEPQPLAPAWW